LKENCKHKHRRYVIEVWFLTYVPASTLWWILLPPLSGGFYLL